MGLSKTSKIYKLARGELVAARSPKILEASRWCESVAKLKHAHQLQLMEESIMAADVPGLLLQLKLAANAGTG